MSDNNTIRAGRICGNPLNGLCERVVIEVKQVFDGCINRFPSLSFQLILTNVSPDLIFPFTFISAVSFGDAVMENQVVTPLTEGRARVQGNIVIPVIVTFTDATGRTGTANSSISIRTDVVLRTPARSLIPYSISVTGSMASEIGSFINPTTVNIICCVVTIVKTTVMTDIVIPTYGYAVYPDCTEGSEDLCTLLLNLPVFPPLT